MNELTRTQKGSPSRDEFKRRHKDLGPSLYASDLDLVLINKHPIPDIVAAIDYKSHSDSITFAEVIAYNALTRRGIPVFIVQGDPETGAFEISRYIGGHHLIPRTEVQWLCRTSTWKEFEEWEALLRREFEWTYSQHGRPQ